MVFRAYSALLTFTFLSVMVNSTSCRSFSSFHSCSSLRYCLRCSCWYTCGSGQGERRPGLEGLGLGLCCGPPTFPEVCPWKRDPGGIWGSHRPPHPPPRLGAVCHPSFSLRVVLPCISGPCYRSWHALRPSGSP